MVWEKEERLQRPIQFVDVVIIDTANEDGRDLDVTFFPSWLQGITSKPVEKSCSGLFPC